MYRFIESRYTQQNDSVYNYLHKYDSFLSELQAIPSHSDSPGASILILKQFNGISDKVKQPLSALNELQNKLQKSEKIKKFIAGSKTSQKSC